MPFPLMNTLPDLVDATGWTWERFSAQAVPSENFWLGIDRDGNRWLTKLRGADRAYREIVFARLAQSMGWSCQSSVFLRLDKQSAKVMGAVAGEVHAAHWFLDEHSSRFCSSDCDLKFLCNCQTQTLEDLSRSKISHILDWPKSELAAYLFGGNEPPDRLFTVMHELVIIDSESMFATGPCSFDTSPWWKSPSGQPSRGGRALAEEVCHDLIALADNEIEEILCVPKGVSIEKSWLIAHKLQESRKFAAQFCA